jgi:hypothetical protein
MNTNSPTLTGNSQVFFTLHGGSFLTVAFTAVGSFRTQYAR